jgi:hypothetical protein
MTFLFSRARAVGCVFVIALASVFNGGRLNAQITQLRGFTDLRYSAGSRDSSGFKLGQLGLFATSDLGNGFSFLGETVFEFDDNDFVVDIERLSVSYSLHPWLRLTVGKHHNPIGYWNAAYHHGTVLQPTIDRPVMFRFEDEGGVLPIHSIGLMASGRDISTLHLGYDVLLSNGLGSNPHGDNNGAKAVTVRLSTQATSELLLGVSGYADRVSAGVVGPGGDTLAEPLRLGMGGAYAVYNGKRAEARAEFQRMRVRTARVGARNANLGYAYAGFRAGNLVPYVLYDGRDVGAGNPWLTVPAQHGFLGGLRYDAAATVAFKGEYGFIRELGSTKRGLGLQVAVGF